MRFWMREILGWLLIALGLFIFYLCFVVLFVPRPGAPGIPGILEAPILSIIGIVIFRGGIHLLKVAVAARVCMATQAEARKPPADVAKKKSETPWDW